MNPSLRIFCVLAVLAGLYASTALRVNCNEDVDKGSDAHNDAAKSPSKPPQSVESLLPDPEKLIPQFEPETGQDGGPDTGLTPVRWLNQND